MKQVIFLCLLSLTLCLSKPAEPEVSPSHAANKVGDAKDEKASEQTVANPVPTPTALAQSPVAPVQTQATPQQSTPAEHPQQAPKADTHTETQKANTVTTTDSNKTSEKKDDPKTKTTEGTKAETSTPVNTHTDVKPTPHETKPKEKPEEASNNMTTPVPVTPKPTDAAKTEEPKTNVTPKDEDKHVVQARGFDGPSFMGGIILSLGLLAIGFMGFKYYKNQTERNYHTL